MVVQRNLIKKPMKPTPKPNKPKPIPLLKDKKAMEEIKADPKQVLGFFQNCIKKPSSK